MRYIKNFLYYLSVIVAIFILATSLMSMATDTSWRYFKMLDFPRLQYFFFGGATLLVFIWVTEKWRWYDILFAAMIATSMVCQTTYLINYTPLVAKAVPNATSEEEGLKFMVFNLLIENKSYEEALAVMEKADADILVTLETTPVWEEKLVALKNKYPHTTETINDVGYGMTIYSKFEMQDLERHYLHDEKVPSYSFKIEPEGSSKIQIYSLHPPPPKYFKEMPDNEGKEEKELTIIGERIKKDNMPTIVFGDLNDVAWGDTDQLMHAGGRLHDVRVGRGFYNSFSAHSFLMKWPLDHFFVTEHFVLNDLQKLDNAGSDHFPIMATLSLKK